jgi:hypothetical protein
MAKLNIYCTTIRHLDLLDKLPSYVIPLGLGNTVYPDHWLTDKKGTNISELNKFYGEATGFYWIWKNRLKDLNDNDWIGTCHYRKLWLNNLYKEKQKLTTNSLYSNLLKSNNEIFVNNDVIQVQPTFFKNENIFQQFEKVHKSKVLESCINFLGVNERNQFKDNLNGNKLCGLNMFITKVYLFKEYCEVLFPWLEKSLEYCLKNNLCKDYNTRLPAFLTERFTSYWFSKNSKKKYLSYARIGEFMLSNSINKFINPTKIPFTFRMYPTIHNY